MKRKAVRVVNIVFVCTGNLCRSPMAEGVLRDRWVKLGRTDLTVSSMGIHGLDSRPAEPFAVEVCRENGIDISAHRSRQLVPAEMENAHLVLTMEPVQRDYITLFMPRFKDKIVLLGSWPEKDSKKDRILDPMRKPMKAYQRTFEAIASHVDRVLPFIVEYFG